VNQLKRDLNRPIKRVSIAVLVLFLILLVNVNYLQAVEAPSLANGPLNDRTEFNDSQVQRGNIVTADGVTIASSRASNDGFKYQRSYADGTVYAPVTGYDTVFTAAQAPNYATGVERAENSLLSGTGDQLAFRNFIDMITDKPQKGATVEVTINSKAQQAAYAGLQSILAGKTINGVQQVGGVVALNPSTGAILAMASYPSYDPNELTVPNTQTAANLVTKLTQENPSPLLNNASQTTLPPGSTFKIVTTSTWYTQNPVAHTPTTAVYSPQPLKLPNGNVLNDDNDAPCGDNTGQTQVIVAFAESCNTPFANIGMELGGQAIGSFADKYGFNTALAISGVTTAASNFTAESDASFTAYDAIGQHDTTETPLQEAMIAETVANGGVEMKPYLIQQVTASDLSVVSQTQPQQLATPISPTVAAYEKQMMIAVVQDSDGTAYQFNAGAEGVEIAGKTGTAQNGSTQSDAVFTAFAPADNPKIAVGVMIEGGGYGAQAAAPIAVAVIKAYLQASGQG